MVSFFPLKLSTFETIINRIAAGHGMLVTFTGLTAVFLGLGFLWFVTAKFQYLASFLEKKSARGGKGKKSRQKEKPDREEAPLETIAAAISVALCCELEDEEISVITLRQIEQDISPWVVASRQSTMRH